MSLSVVKQLIRRKRPIDRHEYIMGTELELDLGGSAGHPGMHGHPTIIHDPPMGHVSVIPLRLAEYS